jgi:hypothetical protein
MIGDLYGVVAETQCLGIIAIRSLSSTSLTFSLQIINLDSPPRIFISYSRSDVDFARRLSRDLVSRGGLVWMDEKEISVGDSISESVEKGLATVDFFCLVLSAQSVSRPWVQREYRTALNLQLAMSGNRPRILPLVIDNVDVPILLKDIRYADFTASYIQGLEQLCRAVGLKTTPAPFLDLLDILDINAENGAAKVRALLENGSYKSREMLHALWPALLRNAHQLELELNDIPSDRLIRTSDSRVVTDLASHLDKVLLLRVPAIEWEDAADYDNVMDWTYVRVWLEGIEPLLEKLLVFAKTVSQRRLYLIPTKLTWHYDGSFPDGPGENGEISFEKYLHNESTDL